MLKHSLCLAALTITLGCATEGMSADEHRARAAQDDAKAAAHNSRYDPEARAVALTPTPDGNGMVAQDYNPTQFEKDTAVAHQRDAEKHRDAARELERSENVACRESPPASRSACPLLFPTKVVDMDHGVRVTFADVAAADRAEALISCQQAFAVTRGFEDVPSCALYARGLKVKRDGTAIELTSSDDAAVDRLRQNVRGHHQG